MIYAETIVTGLNRFYRGHFQNTPNIKTFFGYAITRWIKSVLKVSGVDVDKFLAHSCRSASTSRNQLAGLSLSDIMRSAGWSNASTFAKQHNKPIINENFGDCLLSDFVNSV